MKQEIIKIIIFSVNQANETRWNNSINRSDTIKFLKDNKINFIELFGSYKNNNELSFLVEYTNETKKLVETLIEKYNQECYLVSNENRETHLVYQNGSISHIGTLHAVDQSDALKSESWSYNPVTKTYYITS